MLKTEAIWLRPRSITVCGTRRKKSRAHPGPPQGRERELAGYDDLSIMNLDLEEMKRKIFFRAGLLLVAGILATMTTVRTTVRK